MNKNPERTASPGAGRMGMILFLMALGVLFAAALTGFLVIRIRAEVWPPAGSPGLPAGLWISTLILLLSGLTLHLGLSGIRRGNAQTLTPWLGMTSVLGVAFLVSQAYNWGGLVAAQAPPQASLFAFTFYMLTGLHAAHVLGGLVPLILTTARSARGRYTPSGHQGVVYLSMYWHFLDVVWLILLVVLWIAT